MFKILDRSCDLKSVDSGIKNKFRWSWLEEKDTLGDYFSDYVRKIDIAGSALCIWCHDTLKYSSSGKKDLRNHSKSEKHLKARNIIKTNQTLPAVFQTTADIVEGISKPSPSTSSASACNMPYGAASNIHDTQSCSYREPIHKPNVSLMDRNSVAEALMISFVAEHSLSLSMTPHIIGLAQELARDPVTLNRLSMERTTASYKLRDGLAHITKKRIINDMKTHYFSINVDECTSSSNMSKVFSIIVCYFSEELQQCVTQHYESISLTVVNSATLHKAVCDLFERDGIPFTNLVSCLSDSTNYMRGKISGFETRLRTSAPHMLDIDGDICHHVHNIVKKFCSHFDNYPEKLVDDLFTDFHYSRDLLENLKEMCMILNVPFHTPAERVAHRWLSAYDVVLKNLEMMDAFIIFYFAWIPADLRDDYQDYVDQVTSGLSQAAKERLNEIIGLLRKKKLTPEGRARKLRIVDSVFYHRNQTLIYFNMYSSVLPMFKSLILVFESKQPMIHRVLDELTELVRSFFACFIKVEKVRDLSSKKLVKLDVGDASLHQANNLLFIGEKASRLLGSLRHNDPFRQSFRKTVLEAYISASKYMQMKLPLENKLFRAFSALDPRAQGHSVTQSALLTLKDYFPNIITDADTIDSFSGEIRRLQLDPTLPDALHQSELKRLDCWWADVLSGGHYPVLGTIVKACLSVFTGPHVEQSFSVMNDIMDKKSNRMHVQTYGAYQTVKYNLKSENTTSLKRYHRKNVQTDPIDKSLVYHIQTAYGRYKRKLTSVATQKAETAKKLKLHASPSQSTKKSVHQLAKEVKQKLMKTTKSKR